MDIATSRNGLRALRGFFGLLVVFLYAPILILAIFSFNDGVVPAFPLKGFTLHWYEQFLSNPELLAALQTSAKVAVVSSVLSVILGVLAAIVMVRRRFLGKAAVSAFLLSPLVIPFVVFAIALLILFFAVDAFLRSTFGLEIGLGWRAVVIGHVVVSLPYTILVLVPRLERINVALEEAAQDLGASGLRTFRSITLPLIMPAIVSAFLIAFTLSFDEFAIASFLAGTDATYPLYLFSSLRVPTRLPEMLAVSVVVLLLSMIVVLLAEIGRRVAERRLAVELAAAGGRTRA